MKPAPVTALLVGMLLLMAPLPSVSGQQSIRGTTPGIRGVWVHPATFPPDSMSAIPMIESTLDSYVKAGINTVMILVKTTSGHVYFRSDIGVRDPAYSWDFFGAFLEKAAMRNIAVHPWFCVFTEAAVVGRVREHPEWLIRSRQSELVAVVNPALPDVRRYEIALLKELVGKYPVEWIHLDYIRYPCEPTEDYFSFDTRTRAAFKEYSGVDIATVRSMDSGNILWNEWIGWNGEQVTRFLRELRQALHETGRHVRLSAAVFPDAANAGALVGQEWERWAQEGLVDMLCPMLYTDNHTFFEKYARRAVEIAKGRCLLGIGIGIATADCHNTPEEVLDQIKTARAVGADGSVLFSSGSLTGNLLELLAKEESGKKE